MTSKIPYSDFQKLDLRVAKVLEAEEIEGKDKLLKLKIQLTKDDQRTLVAGIKQFYKPKELINKKIIIIANLEPAKISGITSEGMLLAASTENHESLALLIPDKDIEENSKIY
jgi:methionyl-tRNA synthetase